jgi:hypothetical protein
MICLRWGIPGMGPLAWGVLARALNRFDIG